MFKMSKVFVNVNMTETHQVNVTEVHFAIVFAGPK